MRELDDVDLLVICAEAVTEPQGVNLIAWTLKASVVSGEKGAFARMMNHPSMQWWILQHCSFLSSKIIGHPDWYGELR